MEEIFLVVDENGNKIGEAPRSICHNGSMLLHPVIHLHVFNSKGELFLQKRADTKDIQPGKWDSSVGGHLGINETPQEAVMREASEEIGITGFTPYYIEKHIIETGVERELTYCYYTIYNGHFCIDNEEVSEGRFWKLKDISSLLGTDTFTPNFEMDFKNFLNLGLEALNNNYFP